MEKYVNINLQIIRIAGAWHPNDCSTFQMYISLLLRILTSSSVLFIFIPSLISIRDNVRACNTFATVESVILAISSGIIIYKATSIIMRRDQLRILLSNMSRYWENATPREIRVMTGFAEIGRNLTRIYAVMGVFSSVAIVAYPIVLPDLVHATNTSETTTLRLPFDGWKNVEAMQSTSVYALFFGIHVMCTLLATALSIGYDCLFTVLILHVCAELRALGDTLSHITISEHNEIQRCGITFNSIVQYASELDDMLHGYLLFQTCCSTVIICLTGYIVSRVNLNGNNEVLKYGIYFGIALYQLFLYCWAGNHLLSESAEVGRSAYDAYGKLIGLDPANNKYSRVTLTKLAKQLQMILLRAQYQVKITAGRFYVMSLESYKSILSTSYSYFTVLRAATDPKS